MTIKQFERANKTIEEIKALDKEIIAIERHALLMANGEVKIDLKLSIQDLGKKKEEEAKVAFDEDGSIIQQAIQSEMRRMMGGFQPVSFQWHTCDGEKEEKHKHTFEQTIEDTEGLQVLGILLGIKTAKRDKLRKRLLLYNIEL